MRTANLCPLVAVNPIYMHPFTVARMIATFAYLYKRKTYLNMVTGTALSYLQALNDHLSHNERYDRLGEYVELLMRLTASTAPVSFDGTYYKTKNLTLRPGVPVTLQPTFLFAGHSAAAARISRTAGGIHMQMLPPGLTYDLTAQAQGMHFGIVTRQEEAQAWAVARETFPEDRYGQRLLSYSMSNTDSVWKIRLKQVAEMAAVAQPGYWLEPFRNFQADCPYFIGSYQQVTALLVALVRRGITVFILDIPAREEDFSHIEVAFKDAEKQLRAENDETRDWR
jgi:alkanesulfonate monooxygenase